MAVDNVLLLMTDQQRFDSLGVYGCSAISTPNLDRLAASGVVFDHCYVNNTICTPSRASILTGRPLAGHGVFQLHDTLPDDQILFPKRLQERGYQTALVGKLHVSGRLTEAVTRHPNDGFEIYDWCMDPTIHLDSPYNAYARWLQEKHPAVWKRLESEGRQMHYFPEEAHLNHWAADRTIEFLDSRDTSRPFFCFTSLFDPHDPYFDYPKAWVDAVDLEALGPPQPYPESSEPHPRAIDLEQQRWADNLEGRGPYRDLDEMRTGYYASIAYLDHELGRILDHLEESGLADSTTVIFLSDHGDMMGDRKLLTKGPYFYDPCSRVPMIARFATGPASTRYEELVQPNDVAATVLAAAGFSADERAAIMPHSVDLRALVSGEVPRRDVAVCEYRNTGYGTGGRYYSPEVHATMIHDGRYKMSVFHEGDSTTSLEMGELYDMIDDPAETRNLWSIPEFADTKLRLAIRLADWNTEVTKTYVGGRGGERVPWQEGAQVYVP
jgi:arylsulfatase A-like enzyme